MKSMKRLITPVRYVSRKDLPRRVNAYRWIMRKLWKKGWIS